MEQKDLLIVTELSDGLLDETGRGILAYGSRLAETLQCNWRAITLSSPQPEAVKEFADYGTPAVTKMKNAEDSLDTPLVLGEYLAELAGENEGGVIVFAHSDLGCTLAPVLAAKLDAALVTEVIAVHCSGQGVHLSRRVLGTRLSETRIWKNNGFLVITVPTRHLSSVNLPTTAASNPQIAEFTSGFSASKQKEMRENVSVIVERTPPDPETVDLTEAEVIFCVGKGCDETTFWQVEALCRLLRTSLGVSRPVYDLGWADFSRMIGQTGKTVKPRLYLALGVSGSMHHVGGIKDSERIVAVNIDAKAPIFPNSDQGFVADIGEVLPRLIEKVRSATGEKA